MLHPDVGRPSPKDSETTVNPLETLALPRQFKTSKGSVYTYGKDASVTRFKTVTGEKFNPSDICVFLDASEPYFEFATGISLHSDNTGLTLFLTESATDGSLSFPIRLTDIKDPTKLAVQIWASGEGDPTLKFTKPAHMLEIQFQSVQRLHQ